MKEELPRDELDRTTKLRRRVLPAVHEVKRRVGGYAQCTMHPSEYVGTIDRTLTRFADELREMEFRKEPIAALKSHQDGRLSAGSWVYRSSLFANEQLHVTLFRTDGGSVDTFAHREFSWLTHPYRHYRSVGWDTDRGVTEMRSLLTEHEIPFRIGIE